MPSKRHFLFRVKEGSTAEEALPELSSFLTDSYEMDDPESGAIQIGGHSDQEIPTIPWKHVILEEISPLEEVDWQQQWADFAPRFHDGLAHIDLGGPVLLLKPGRGFGDFSHPTTRLVLRLMAEHVKDQVVFDIGCGSGILTIAAVLLGAKKAYGIDIEEGAIQHSIENAAVNHVTEKTHFAKKINPAWIPLEPCVIVMNMIESEQKIAWESLPLLHSLNATVIISGLLFAQKEHYRQLAKSWGWSLVEEREEEGWNGFIFLQNSS
jgi:ribosomal protein L11 methyltransferase